MADSGFVDISKITNVKDRVIVKQVFGLAQQQLKLRTICKVIPMPKLTADVRVATSLAGQRHVKELQEARLDSIAFTKVSFDLATYGKNVVHVAISEEANRQTDLNLLDIHVQDAATALATMENMDIAEELDTLSAGNNITGSSWAEANDPADDIMAAVEQIESQEKGFTADTIVMHPTVYAKLVSNEEVRKYIDKSSITEKGELKEICGLKVLKHPALSQVSNYQSVAFVLDTKAPGMVFGDGPKMAKKIDGGAKFYTSLAIAKWGQPKLLLTDAIVRITNIG